jgi:hypothetical protein
MGLTQPSEATVIFWTADLRVTASARLVLVMIRAPALVVASPDPSMGGPTAGRAHLCHSETAILRTEPAASPCVGKMVMATVLGLSAL